MVIVLPKCSKCEVELNQDNWHKCHQNRSDNNCKRFVCKNCSKMKTMTYRKEHKKPHKITPKICAICQKSFNAITSLQTNCSEECRKTYRNLYSKKWRKNKYHNNSKWREIQKEKGRDNYFKDPEKNITSKKRERTFLKQLIGNRCILCGSKKRLTFHEIHGKKHPLCSSYYRNHKEDFVSLCQRHHVTLHIFASIKDKEMFIKIGKRMERKAIS